MNSKYCSSPEEAVKIIESGHRVFIHSAAATPVRLVEAMTARHKELRDVEIVSIHTEGPAPYAEDKYSDSFKISAFFIGSNIRKAVQRGRAHYVPVFLSEIPSLFRSGEMPLDVAMVTVSSPNEKGFCSLGCSVDVSNSAIDNAKYVIAQVNPNMPFVHGNGILHMDKITRFIEVDDPLFEVPIKPPTEIEKKIGQNVAELIGDGATLQMGIGGIPNAVLHSLSNHKGLGVHSEMISDGVVDLYEKGVITGMNKKTDLGKIVAGFAFGSRNLYDFIDHNPIVNMMDVSYVNDTRTIRSNPNFVAINSAIEIDLLGQICADSIGTKHYSGVGGQMDFVRGAALSEGGKAIIALPARTHKGIPRIVSTLKTGASVVTTRAHVQYVATEYGVAYLYAQNFKERIKRMIQISHPDDQEELSQQAYDTFKVLV